MTTTFQASNANYFVKIIITNKEVCCALYEKLGLVCEYGTSLNEIVTFLRDISR